MLDLDFPSSRTAPEHFVRRLRAIHPHAVCVWVEPEAGLGEWWYGVIKPSAERRRKGQQMLARGLRDNIRPTFLQGKLMLQGFAYYGSCTLPEPGEETVRRFQMQEAATLAEMNARFSEMEADADGTRRKADVDARLQDFADAEGKSLYRNRIKNRVFFT